MGDTGPLGLAAALGGLAIMTRTELLLVILRGLFVIQTTAVMIKVSYVKATKPRNGSVGKRVFRITPIHHHFELLGWDQVTITTQFWIICGLCVAIGLGVFHGEWIVGI